MSWKRLEKLVDSSLVRTADSDGGEPRFVMLQTIHEFASELLDAGPDAEHDPAPSCRSLPRIWPSRGNITSPAGTKPNG